MNSRKIYNARERRKSCTVSEGLLWSVLRARQVCDLKFRREHPIGGFIADFACEAMKLVVEIDGGYHDLTGKQDVVRENTLRELGWDVLRFSDKEVEGDIEAVARAIATHLGLKYSFRRRAGGGSGTRARSSRTSEHLLGPSSPSP
ncbi:MAG: endonuclease domain-containing protein [Planctomycetaceae bacterium]